jgi:hypothetical protein
MLDLIPSLPVARPTENKMSFGINVIVITTALFAVYLCAEVDEQPDKYLNFLNLT